MRNFIYIVFYVCFIQICFGQKTLTIKGKVIAQDLKVVPLAEIKIGDSIIGKTDLGGEFGIEINSEVRKITFSFVGLEETQIIFNSGCSKLEIVMLFSGGDCFAKPKKNERIRKKRFNKLSSFYRQAYEKGIFESDTACGEIQFIPWFP